MGADDGTIYSTIRKLSDFIDLQQKRITELKAALVEIRYHTDGVIKIQPIYDIANKALSEGGTDAVQDAHDKLLENRRRREGGGDE